jgi:hypothetical protein
VRSIRVIVVLQFWKDVMLMNSPSDSFVPCTLVNAERLQRLAVAVVSVSFLHRNPVLSQDGVSGSRCVE